MFDNYVASFMGDEHPPEDAERREQELTAILQKHVEELNPPRELRTIEGLARWFQQQKERIEALPLDDRVKRLHLVNVNQRYAELTTKLLEELEP